MYSSSENSNNSTTQSKRCRRRQWRELETWFFAALILSTAFVGGGQARNIQRPLRSHQPLIRAAAPKSSWTSSYAPVTGPHTNDDFAFTEARSLTASARQDDFGSIASLISLAIKYVPTIISAYNTFTGLTSGTAGSSASATNNAVAAASTNNVDRVETPAAPFDPFSWSNLLSMGIKVALQLVSSYASDGIDKADTISPTQAVLGTVISALTGSQNPKEVALFAKQADQILDLVSSLVEALYTSVTS